jgi:hypothetical protein
MVAFSSTQSQGEQLATRVAVVIPGIMGSSLYYSQGRGQRYEIWGEDFYENYKRLLSNSTLLRWDGTPAESSLLESVYPSTRIRLKKIPLWEALLGFLNKHPEFGNNGQTLKHSYDWRQSLLETARHLGERIDRHTEDLVSRRGLADEDLRYVFFTHSMGGLVVRIALALGALDPVKVDRIVHIGTPLRGAPAAFRSAYERGSLPLLRELFRIFYRKNEERFFEHLLRNIRTFPSIYQLMPPAHEEYLFYSPGHRSNPLGEHSICDDKRELANQAHQRLTEGEEVITAHNIKTYTIYSESHTKCKTDREYEVQQLGQPEPGYRIFNVISTDMGDGTVLKWSAEGSGYNCKRKPLQNVTHAYMCNQSRVVELLPGIL